MDWSIRGLLAYAYYYLAERFGFDPDPSDDRNVYRNQWGSKP